MQADPLERGVAGGDPARAVAAGAYAGRFWVHAHEPLLTDPRQHARGRGFGGAGSRGARAGA